MYETSLVVPDIDVVNTGVVGVNAQSATGFVRASGGCHERVGDDNLVGLLQAGILRVSIDLELHE